MQIVIEIDEDIYNRFTHDEGRPRCEITEEERFQMNADAVRLTRAFCNGTPLPEGHGRLKDVDWIADNCEDHYSDKYGSCFAWIDIDSAPTIVGTEKSESEVSDADSN